MAAGVERCRIVKSLSIPFFKQSQSVQLCFWFVYMVQEATRTSLRKGQLHSAPKYTLDNTKVTMNNLSYQNSINALECQRYNSRVLGGILAL